MPHQSFGTVRQGTDRDPITFDFGLYGEDTFTVVPEPSLGDTFDLYDAPEPTPTNVVESAQILARFIRKMIVPEQKKAFDQALYRIPATRADIIVSAAHYIIEQLVPFAIPPSGTSSNGQAEFGNSFKTGLGGTSG